jgi:exonuclease III
MGHQPKKRQNNKNTRANLKIASLNMKGRWHRCVDKWCHINQVMRDRKISLLALQETHLTKSEEDSLNSVFHEKLHIVSSIDTTHPNAKGVALVWNKMTTNTHGIVSHEIVPGRALLATVPWHREERMTILVVYAPNDPTHIREFWETIKIELGNLPKPDVILGDFNLVEDALDRLPPHLDPLSASEPLQDLKRSLKLTDGWRRENPDSISFHKKRH